MKETELSEPLSLWLGKQGYTVSCEVKNCDIVARKDDELLIIELKTRFSLDLVYQAVNRKNLTESVYVAVPVLPGKKSIPKLKEVKKLLYRLEVGLILVRFLKTKTRVEVISHPGKFNPRKASKRRTAIIREIDGRYSEFNKAGSATRDQRISAYKQQALICAWLLNKNGNMSPISIVKLGGGVKTQQILSGNIYGWFDKVSRGIYTLNPAGKEALKNYKEVVKEIIKKIDFRG
ncbi:MAG: DUF2161 family putative PD-(D/E)XK-type phosphodiesterase [Spirochaetia bacterium]|jgi:hypothetical protein|nr:DUF2161 family putative PD-(D/E)XK-type phosphodiesterase [Spirochaetia bacterium]